MTSPIVAMTTGRMRRWVAFDQFIRIDTVVGVYRIEPWEPARSHSSIWSSLESYKSLDLGVLH